MQKLVRGLRRIYQAMDAFEIFDRKTITSIKSYSYLVLFKVRADSHYTIRWCVNQLFKC